MTEFCKKCGQKLAIGLASMFAQHKAVEFEDGFYCEKCAKIKVEEARNKK